MAWIFSKILYKPEVGPEVAIHRVRGQDHALEQSLDRKTLVPLCAEALEKRPHRSTSSCRSATSNRTVGTILGL